MQILSYIFWPNPGNAHYDSPKAIALLIFCVLLIVASFVLSRWRKGQKQQALRRLSKSWASAAFWFGFTGLLLVVARVENIQYIAMRLWWLLWALIAAWYLFIQVRSYRRGYYEVLPNVSADDPRAKYLPKRKR